MIKTTFIILMLSLTNLVFANPQFIDTEKSFAEEYKNLRILLEKVTDPISAQKYKPVIEEEIQRLRQTQHSGGDFFNSLTNTEKKLFVKRFQQNRFHCGEVTQVMQERRRILFSPKLSLILADTLAKIP